MEEKKEGKKPVNRGAPAIYDEECHIALLKEVLSEGKTRTTFCARALISVSTFEFWLRNHPEFKSAYRKYLNLAADVFESKLDRLIDEGKASPYVINTIYRNRFSSLYESLPKTKGKGVKARAKSAWKAREDGKINSQEYCQLMTGIMSQLKLDELVLQQKALELQNKPTVNLKNIDDEAFKAFMAVKMGKKVNIEE